MSQEVAGIIKTFNKFAEVFSLTKYDYEFNDDGKIVFPDCGLTFNIPLNYDDLYKIVSAYVKRLEEIGDDKEDAGSVFEYYMNA